MDVPMTRSFDATRALSESTQFNMAAETRSKALADDIVKKLETVIKTQAAMGATECTWNKPESGDCDFNLVLLQTNLSKRILSHYW